MRRILKEKIREKGYSVSELTKVIGFGKSTLYNHITGITNLGIDKALKLADLLEISLDDVYAD